METRCIKDFAADLIQEVIKLSQTNTSYYTNLQQSDLQQRKHNILMLLRIAAKLEFDILLDLLNQKSVCYDLINTNSLSCFYLFLKARWNEMFVDGIPRTDNTYNLSPYSPINQACIALAKALLKELPGNENQHIYDLLMPTCDFKQIDPLTNKPYYDLQLHQFVIGHEGKLLNIEWCFQCLETSAEEKRKRAATTSRYTPRHTQMTVPKLSGKDERLVSWHSALANEYYEAIQRNQSIDGIKSAFLEALKTNDYVVTASYGEQNKDFLMQTVLKDIVESTRGFTTFIHTYVNKDEWTSFLKLVPKDKLFHIMLGINLNEQDWIKKSEETLYKSLNANYPFKNQDEIRVFILCILQVYEVIRTEKPDEYNSLFGNYLGSRLGLAHSKQAKLQACEIYREFLTSKYEIMDLNGFLIHSSYGNYSSLLIPTQGIMDTVVSTVSNNFLTHIVKLANDLAMQLTHKPVVPSKYGSFNLT